MVRELIDGISVKLHQMFGRGYRIYADEAVAQGMMTPCFFIVALNPSIEKQLEPCYLLRTAIDIHFFPKNFFPKKREKHGLYTEMHRVGERLLDEMEYVELANGDLLRGTDRRYEMVDGVLHFFIRFTIRLVREREWDDMGSIAISENVEG